MAIGTAAAILGGAIIGGGMSLIGSSKAASATKQSADVSSDAQIQQLNYLKEIDAVPQAYRSQAIQRLGSIYGLGGAQSAPTGTQPSPGYGQQGMGGSGFWGKISGMVQERYGQRGPYAGTNQYSPGVGRVPPSEGLGGLGAFGADMAQEPYAGEPGYPLRPVPGAESLPGVPGAESIPLTPGQDSVPLPPGQDSVPMPPGQGSVPDRIGGRYVPGVPGGPSLHVGPGNELTSPYTDRAGFIEGLQSDPFYDMMLKQGEESILRNKSATGGLRSGGAVEGLAQNSQSVLQQLYGQRKGEYDDYEGYLRGYRGEEAGLRGEAALRRGEMSGYRAEQGGLRDEEARRRAEQAGLRGEEGLRRAEQGGLRDEEFRRRLEQGGLRGEEYGRYQGYVGGLQGLAGLPTNQNAIGQTMSNIGGTKAMGIQGSGQAWQQGYGGMANAAMTGAGMYAQYGQRSPSPVDPNVYTI